MTLAELARVFGRIGVMSFGGPAAQIALMHKELVETKAWLTEAQFLRALSFCMLLPGPEAMQLATYAGWRLRGVVGGLIAGLLFVLPGSAVILALALGYAAFGQMPLIQALFLGIKAVVVVIVIEALLKISKRALLEPVHWALAGLAFLAIFVFSVPFPAIILAAGAVGALMPSQTMPEDVGVVVPANQTIRTILIWGTVWLAPLAIVMVMDPGFLGPLALFFSKLALVTFGGAYAVLAYMTQAVVGDLGWLTTAEMMDALGLAETTPGPLILVTEFVAVLAGYKEGGLAIAILAGIVTLWVTFVPCFLWIFAGAPYIDWISARPRLTGALSAITAAVVGVILNLSLWFALHVFFDRLGRFDLGFGSLLIPDPASANLATTLIATVAVYLMLIRHMSLLKMLGLGALAGLLLGLLKGLM